MMLTSLVRVIVGFILKKASKNVVTQQDGVAEGFLNNIIYPMMEVLLRNLAMVKCHSWKACFI